VVGSNLLLARTKGQGCAAVGRVLSAEAKVEVV
jgi:hypothetical protein